MANEITVTVSLTIAKGNLSVQTEPVSFTDTMNGTARGGAPGLVRATTNGTDIDLTSVTAPGWMWLMNLDDTNYVRLGLWDPDASRFRPIIKLKPGGKPVLIPLDPDVEEEFITTGTGTGVGTDTNRLRLKADQAACDVLVKVFED